MTESDAPWLGGPNEPLLKTKLFVPRVRPGHVARPRLFALLNQGLSRKLTLLSAPAGSGKTTLLAEWRRTEFGRAVPMAWVSLEAADNRPQRFWLYVVQALDELCPGSLGAVLQLLSTGQPAPSESVVRLLINLLAELELDAVLVLDDYHLIAAEEIHRSVALLLEHLPPQVHLVLTTRADPPLPLTRMRARRELTEVRLKDLRFTDAEAAAFFREAMGLDLTGRQVSLLGERTEGWVAGLQLAALSMAGLADVDRFVEEFAGSHQYIVDYLAEEVLQVQPEPVKRFLLQTAILNRLSGPLCDAVTGGSDGQALLESLERQNLFVIALDHQRQWYRYHHLFAEALRDRLVRERPGEAAVLHRAASLWYQEHGLIELAVDHALAAADFDRAIQMVAEAAERVWLRGDSGLLMAWLHALPDLVVRSRPDIAFAIAWACLTSGRPDLAESLLQTAEDLLSAEGVPSGEMLGKVLASRAHVARVQCSLPAAAAYSHRALSLLPESSLAWRAWAVWNLGAIDHWRGDLVPAQERYGVAMRLFREAGDLYGSLRATVWHAEVLADGGRLPEALAETCAALELAEGQAGADLPVLGLAHLGVGEMRYEQFDLASAEHHLRRSIDLSRRGGLLDVLWQALIALAQVMQGQGKGRAALQCLDQADQIAPKVPWALAYSAVARARLLQVQGSGPRAALLAPQVERLVRDPAAPAYRAALTLAYLKLTSGFDEEALAILEPLAGRTGGQSIRYLAHLALARHAGGQTEGALAALERALTLAAPAAMAAAFLELDRPMADLLRLGTPRWKGAVAGLARQLLDRFGSSQTARENTSPDHHLVDPLSERELEVLALMAQGEANAAIAQRLVVTLHTAKKHVANILSKLGAENRTQAVAKARELGLL